jgi:hypothetical protein
MVLAASAGAPAGRTRGSGTALFEAKLDEARAKMPGRCRGIGTGPRIGSLSGRTSNAATRAGGAAGDGRRDAAKSGGLSEFGFGQAIPRSAEAPLGAALSADRGA